MPLGCTPMEAATVAGASPRLCRGGAFHGAVHGGLRVPDLAHQVPQLLDASDGPKTSRGTHKGHQLAAFLGIALAIAGGIGLLEAPLRWLLGGAP